MKDKHYLAEELARSELADINNSKKDIGGFFGAMKPGAMFALITIGYTLVVLLGAWLGRDRLEGGIGEAETALETAVASVLGLLAFILGFTFSLTWSRFANRNALVVNHAESITTCYLRAGLIPEKQKIETRTALYEYARLLDGIHAKPNLDEALIRIKELHVVIWQQAVSLVNEDIDSELRSLFVSATNELINISQRRKTVALFIRIPDAIWASILFLVFIGMFAFGYQAGIGGIRKMFQLPLLPLAFSLVLVLIADLNSAETKGKFKVTRQPLKEAIEMMEKDFPGV